MPWDLYRGSVRLILIREGGRDPPPHTASVAEQPGAFRPVVLHLHGGLSSRGLREAWERRERDRFFPYGGER